MKETAFMTMIWCLRSLSTLFKSYRDDGSMMMKGPAQWCAVKTGAEVRLHRNSNPRPRDSNSGCLYLDHMNTDKLLEADNGKIALDQSFETPTSTGPGYIATFNLSVGKVLVNVLHCGDMFMVKFLLKVPAPSTLLKIITNNKWTGLFG